MWSTVPGHASLQADLTSWLICGWFFSNSSGLPAKQIITASTELDIIENKIFDKTTPTKVPILLHETQYDEKTCHHKIKAYLLFITLTYKLQEKVCLKYTILFSQGTR